MPGEPGHDVVVDQPVRIEKNQPTATVPPIEDVLADAVFEEFRLAHASPAADIDVALTGGGRERDPSSTAEQIADFEGVAGHAGDLYHIAVANGN